jgi:hypothetical protein
MSESAFKDRRDALIAMGVLVILGGLFLLLLGGISLLPAVLLKNQSYNTMMVLPAVVIYFLTAGWLITMGIGTIRAKRWACRLMLAASWFSLFIGIMATAMMVLILPGAFSRQMPRETATIVTAIVFLFTGFIYLVIPLIGILFYSGRNVRATCEHLHPEPSWPEQCPLPVLIPALWLGTMPVYLTTSFTCHFATPVFGFILSGLPGAAVSIGIAIICPSLAYGLYKLRPAAWWGTVVLFAVGVTSGLITFSRISMDDFYAAANYSEQMLQHMQQSPWVNNSWFIKISLLSTIPIIGYLLLIKRYFPQLQTKGK